MKKVTGFSQSDTTHDNLENNRISQLIRNQIKDCSKSNLRACPSCGMMSLSGMPGGRDATCKNCGFKDPCCYDS